MCLTHECQKSSQALPGPFPGKVLLLTLHWPHTSLQQRKGTQATEENLGSECLHHWAEHQEDKKVVGSVERNKDQPMRTARAIHS